MVSTPSSSAPTSPPRRDAVARESADVAILERLRTPVWIYDFDRKRVVWANASGLVLWRADDVETLAARDLAVDMSPTVATRLAQYQADFERDDITFSETWTLYPEGRPTTLRVLFSGRRLADGRMGMTCEALAEITDTPERLRSAEALLHTTVMITLFDVDGRALYRNPAARQSRARVGESFAARFADPADHAAILAALDAVGSVVRQVRVVTSNGVRWHEISARQCRDAVNGLPAVLVSETDVTAHKAAEAQVRFLAEHDTLTGLPNRAMLQPEIERRLRAAEAAGREVAILFVDLDRFKTINDSLGHSIGDGLLVVASRRLGETVRANDFVARLGGDEFLVCLDLDCDAGRAAQTAERILAVLDAPIRIGGVDLTVSASIGIGLFPRDGRDLDTLMRHADLAMYTAKAHGCGRWEMFSGDMKADVERQLLLESQLRRALENGEFEVFYQPRLAIDRETIIGAEALLRWHHPTRGLVLPGAFIPFAEKTGQIDKIGACVLREAALQQKAWADAGHDLSISVNLSARQFRDPRLSEMVRDIVRETGCDPGRLQIEITESMLIGDDVTSAACLRALADLGLSIAIDDFGTGYSNLGTIHRHPIDTLKIDHSFVATLETRPALAELIIGMCRLLDMRIVAEGVETEDQLEWLKARNVHEYQGYLFSPAIPADHFDELLRRQAELAATPPANGRSALWDLVPLVRREGDVEWTTAGETPKVRRLAIAGAVEAFVRRDGH
ncbi:MAG: EAL domain-containing protein [Phyllobacteriaceae bacterium]|nr:EAL domain-containing protein [Phyllobacteriaceae bacterium]